jgi:hypothetical protein
MSLINYKIRKDFGPMDTWFRSFIIFIGGDFSLVLLFRISISLFLTFLTSH